MRILKLANLLAGLSGLAFTTAVLPPHQSQRISPAIYSSSSSNDGSITKRDDPIGNIGGLYMCTGAGFTGTCFYHLSDIGQCYNMFPDWQNQITSWGPDNTLNKQDAFRCTLFDQLHCIGKKIELGYPGTGNLALFQMDNNGKSFSCSYTVPR